MDDKKAFSWALFFAGTWVLAAILVSRLLGLGLKYANPLNVDITSNLAYLGHAIVGGLIVGAVFLALFFILAFQVKKDSLYHNMVRVLVTVAFVQILLVVVILTLQKQEQNLVDRAVEIKKLQDPGFKK